MRKSEARHLVAATGSLSSYRRMGAIIKSLQSGLLDLPSSSQLASSPCYCEQNLWRIASIAQRGQAQIKKETDTFHKLLIDSYKPGRLRHNVAMCLCCTAAAKAGSRPAVGPALPTPPMFHVAKSSSLGRT